METVKEKLVKLISEFVEHIPHADGQTWEDACAYFLLSNGVTLQDVNDTNVGNKWVSVDEPPKKEGWYHVAILDTKTGKYKVENDLYAIETAKAHKHEPGFCKANRWPARDKITHWCPYPQPPKEVQ